MLDDLYFVGLVLY